MQMVKKSFIALLVFWLALLVFMPKQALYFKLEKALEQKEIIISGEKIEEGFFSLTLKKPTIYVKGIKVATVDEIKFFTLLFYTSVVFENLSLDDSLKAMAPQNTRVAILKHSWVTPLALCIDAEGDFGVIDGSVDIAEHKVHIDFTEPGKLGNLKKQLRRDEKGWYYETSF